MGSLRSSRVLGYVLHSTGNCHFSSVKRSSDLEQETLRNCEFKTHTGSLSGGIRIRPNFAPGVQFESMGKQPCVLMISNIWLKKWCKYLR